jgi:hypothetical protein
MSDPNDSARIANGVLLASASFLKFCANVRNSDLSILSDPGEPFRIRNLLSEKQDIELAGALLESKSVTYLELETAMYTKSSAEAMAKYMNTSKRLRRIKGLKVGWQMVECCGSMKKHSVVFCLHFKKARNSRN